MMCTVFPLLMTLHLGQRRFTDGLTFIHTFPSTIMSWYENDRLLYHASPFLSGFPAHFLSPQSYVQNGRTVRHRP